MIICSAKARWMTGLICEGEITSKKKGQILIINLLLVSTTNINQTDNKFYSFKLTGALKSSNYIVF